MTAAFRVRRRAGFTLIEMLVVVALMLMLLGLAAAVVPGILDADRTNEGSARLMGWLQIARQRAIRDQAPRGLRLLVDPTTTNQVREVQYVEVPPMDLPNPDQLPAGAYLQVEVNLSPMPAATYGQPTLKVSNLPSNLQGGESVYVPELGLTFPLSNANPPYNPMPSGMPPLYTLTLLNPNASATKFPLGAAGRYKTVRFGYVRQPQPLLGEPTLQLPTNIVVQTDASQGLPAINATANAYDVLFDPSGKVMNSSQGLLMLWVRDATKGSGATDVQNAGNQQIVALRTRTGATGVSPINTDPPAMPDYYKLAKQFASVAGE